MSGRQHRAGNRVRRIVLRRSRLSGTRLTDHIELAEKLAFDRCDMLEL